MTGLSDAPPYRHVAWCYDAVASGYSLWAIDRAKAWHHRLMRCGDRALYAGAGSGGEIVGACGRGAEVTCVEPCPVTAERLQRRLGRSAERFTLVPRPIQSVPARAEYDLVVAHFFLNVFDARSMPGVLDHLCGFVRPGGRLVIADFKPSAAGAGWLDRAWRGAYYRPVNFAGWLLRVCALHPIYDYAPPLIEHGYAIESRVGFAVLPGMPAAYEVIVARRPAAC